MLARVIHCRDENDSMPWTYQDQLSHGERAYKKTEFQDSDHDPLESMIDQTLEDSFPASDPPAWTLGREPKPQKFDGQESSLRKATSGGLEKVQLGKNRPR